MRVPELEHRLVPVLARQHCEDQHEAVEEVLEVDAALSVVLVRENLHTQQHVDEHQQEEEY